MALLGNVKIKTLSLTGNILLALAAVGGSLLTVNVSSQMVDQISMVSDNSVPSLVALSTLGTDTMAARLTMAKHILASSAEESRHLDGVFSAKEAAVDKDINDYRLPRGSCGTAPAPDWRVQA